MIAFLTSSPFVCNAPRAMISPENDFLKNLKACIPAHANGLYISAYPDDPGAGDRFSQDVAYAFEEEDLGFREMTVLDRRNEQDAQMLIWKADLIVLGGGHVPTQNEFFQEIRLRELLENYQGVIMGISAGTMNSAENVYVQPEEPGESVPEFPRWAPGLGLTDIHVLPHYQNVKNSMLDGKRLFEDVTYADSMGHCFYAFVDGTYLLVEEGRTRLFGEAYRLCDGVMEQITELGDVMEME